MTSVEGPPRRGPFLLWSLACVAFTVVALTGLGTGWATAASLPSVDPFYTPPAVAADRTPGSVLRTRPSRFAPARIATPVASTQVLYRTTDQHGRASSTVTTILQPVAGARAGRVVSFHMAYDALGSQCDPSYTLSGNDPGRIADAESAAISAYLAAGYIVSVPDYEGPDLEWTIGRQSGYAALDGVRATLAVLRLPASTPVGLVGYSGGSVPTEYGAEVAPTYAPELNIVGAAAGGLPVDLAHNLPYINGSRGWAGVIPALTVAYQRAYGLDLDSFLSARGIQVVDEVRDQCIASFAASYPGLTDAQMTAPPYRGYLDVPAVVRAIDDNIMGSAGTPRTPVMLANGIDDGTGDGVMVLRDVEGLANRLCDGGVRTTFTAYPGADHARAFPRFEADAFGYLAGRFAGVAARDNCGSVALGNSLAPAPVPGG